jgi:hypothetical protein
MREKERLNPAGFHGYGSILVLQRSRDYKERAMHNGGVFFFEKLWSDDDVGDACFIFETEKDEPFGGSWALANNDGPSHGYECTVRQRRQLR